MGVFLPDCFSEGRKVARLVAGRISMREVLCSNGLPRAGVTRHRLTQAQDFKVVEHRGFSLDWLQSTLNDDSFRNGSRNPKEADG